MTPTPLAPRTSIPRLPSPVADGKEALSNDRLLRVSEVAGLLAVSRRKAYSLLGHAIPVVALGRRCRRVRLADVLAFIEARRA